MINSYNNYEWFLKQDLSRYSGNWLVIIDKKIVASGKEIDKLLIKIRNKYPNKKPFITKIRNKLSIL